MIAAPTEEAEVAAVVASAFEDTAPLLVRGGGSKLGMLRPVQAARTLALEGLTGITLHAPQELVLSARAGTRIGQITAALAAHGQHLISEPPDLSALLGGGEATIGGIIAANLSGPRRVVWGASRDHVLGLRAVNGSGALFRAGGRVLKNVTGLDLCRLLAGSHGTLGVITEVTMKVLAAPEAVGTLLLPGLDAAAGVAALSAALGSPYGVSGAAWLPGAAAARAGLAPVSATLIRIEEFAASVVYRTGRLRAALAEFGTAEIIGDAPSRALWAAVRDVKPLALAEGDALWRLSVKPSDAPGLLTRLEALGDPQVLLDWGGGLIWLAAPASVEAHRLVCDVVRAVGGTWMLMRGPDGLRAAVDVVPPEPSALAALSRRVKSVMDPRFILNPGRLFAGL